jgi:hypothetical protein
MKTSATTASLSGVTALVAIDCLLFLYSKSLPKYLLKIFTQDIFEAIRAIPASHPRRPCGQPVGRRGRRA